jgi:hypothetical protein
MASASGASNETSVMQIEYLSLGDSVYEDIEKRVMRSYPNACICYIEKVVHPSLEEAFIRRYAEIEGRTGKVEIKQLFHGSTEEGVYNIANIGFQKKYNTTSAFGKGSYFAKNAKYSFKYMRTGSKGVSFMILADVLVGKTMKGTKNLNAPPGIDTMVDYEKNPSIYVTPHDDGAYPRYIIAFHKNAKV